MGNDCVRGLLKTNPCGADVFDMTSEEEEFKARMIELYARQDARCATLRGMAQASSRL